MFGSPIGPIGSEHMVQRAPFNKRNVFAQSGQMCSYSPFGFVFPQATQWRGNIKSIILFPISFIALVIGFIFVLVFIYYRNFLVYEQVFCFYLC